MCGIVGYVGPQTAAPILVEGLRKLEYRGYDSAGIAVHHEGRIEVVRALGKLRALSEALEGRAIPGSVGIGHTRWATHGRPSEHNAHPHLAGGVAVVHNGIIENHVELRQELEAAGVRFSSDTDTEIVAHLVDRELRPVAAELPVLRVGPGHDADEPQVKRPGLGERRTGGDRKGDCRNEGEKLRCAHGVLLLLLRAFVDWGFVSGPAHVPARRSADAKVSAPQVRKAFAWT